MTNKTQKLPNSWEHITLGEIVSKRSRGIVPNKTPDQMFELYSVPSLENGKPDLVAGKEIGSNKQLVDEKTVLLCKINPRINRAWIVGAFSQYSKIASTEWITFPPNESIVSKYLAYFLKQNEVRDFLASNASGVGGSLMRVKPATIQDYRFPVPPTNEQKLIVAEIEKQFSRLDEAVAALMRIKANLKRYKASVLKAAVEGKLTEEWRKEHPDVEPATELLKRILVERKKKSEEADLEKMRAKGKEPKDDKWKKKYKDPLFPDTSNLPELPHGWVWTNIEQLAEAIPNAIKAGPFGSALKKSFYVPKGYKIYGQEQVIKENPYYGDYYIDEDRYNKLSSCAVKPKDILISLVGTIGRVLVLPDDIEPGIINPRLVKLSLDARLISAEFFTAYLQSPYVKYLFTLVSHGGTMDILNLKILKEIPIPLPPIGEQKTVVYEIERVASIEQGLELEITKSIKRAERLRQSILKKAFSGRLVTQIAVKNLPKHFSAENEKYANTK